MNTCVVHETPNLTFKLENKVLEEYPDILSNTDQPELAVAG